MKICFVFSIIFYSNVMYGQRVAPGVPPRLYEEQQYQQQQYPQQKLQHQQFHQPSQQHIPHQQPHFEQPNPAHFQHQPVHQQQISMQQAAGHGHGQPHVLNTANIEHEKQHIAEHLDIPLDTKDMTTEQLQFYYFRMHDADGNNKLDGCELIKSLIHWHEQGNKAGNNMEERIFKDEELVTLIDPILNMDDINHDGYIDYPEFIQAQRKAAAAGAPSKH